VFALVEMVADVNPAHIPASFYRARIEIIWPGWSGVLEVLTQRAVRDRLNGEGELQSGILSYGLPGVERSRA
jgi:hypothetical protein